MKKRLLSEEAGAEALEFAWVAPGLLIVVFGLIYALILLAAQLSLSHAAGVAARYASLPTTALSDDYPDHLVPQKLIDGTPFFSVEDCTTLVNGAAPAGPTAAAANSSVVVEAACEFPNPLGSVLEALMGEPIGGAFAPSLTVTARAQQRRE